MAQNVEGRVNGKRRTLIFLALLLTLVYVGVAFATDAAQLKDALRQLGAAGCSIVLALSAANYLLRFLRWQSYMAKLGRSLPLVRHFAVYLAGFAFTVSPAKTGEAVRALYLRDDGVTYSESLAALFVERLLDMLAIVALASLLAIDHPAYRPLIGAVLLLVVIALAAVCQPLLPRLLERLAARSKGRVAALLSTFGNLLHASRRLLHPRTLLFGILVGLLAWSAEGIGFHVMCQALQISGSPATAAGIYAVAVLAGSAAFFLPAGIGGMELVMTTLLVEQGASLRVAIIATLLCRLATLWFAVLLGAAAALTIEFSNQRNPLRATP